MYCESQCDLDLPVNGVPGLDDLPSHLLDLSNTDALIASFVGLCSIVMSCELEYFV